MLLCPNPLKRRSWGSALQELEETLYWLELLAEAKIITSTRLEALERETNELIAMFVSMAKGVKQRKTGVVIPHPSALIP